MSQRRLIDGLCSLGDSFFRFPICFFFSFFLIYRNFLINTYFYILSFLLEARARKSITQVNANKTCYNTKKTVQKETKRHNINTRKDTRTIRNKTIQDKTINSKIMQNKTIQSKTINTKQINTKQSKTIQNKTIKKKIIQSKTIESKTNRKIK